MPPCKWWRHQVLPGRPSAADDGATTPFPAQVQQEGTQAPGSKALTECILALSRALCSAHHQPAPVETSPAAAAGASLETRRLLSEERAAQAPEEESGPERGPTRHRGAPCPHLGRPLCPISPAGGTPAHLCARAGICNFSCTPCPCGVPWPS